MIDDLILQLFPTTYWFCLGFFEGESNHKGNLDSRCPMAPYDVVAAWKRGEVEHVQPRRPVATKQWPHVPAGPGRLVEVLRMWIDGLPDEKKDTLRMFLPLSPIHESCNKNSFCCDRIE